MSVPQGPWYHGTPLTLTALARPQDRGAGVRPPCHWNAHLGVHFASERFTAERFRAGLYAGRRTRRTAHPGGTMFVLPALPGQPRAFRSEYHLDDAVLAAGLRLLLGRFPSLLTPAVRTEFTELKSVLEADLADPDTYDTPEYGQRAMLGYTEQDLTRPMTPGVHHVTERACAAFLQETQAAGFVCLTYFNHHAAETDEHDPDGQLTAVLFRPQDLADVRAEREGGA